MLFSYNADILPRVRMIGYIRYTEPWIHFARTSDDYILYVIKDGNMYLQEGANRYTLAPGDYFVLEPGLRHEGFRAAACDYYYVHFTHPQIYRVSDDAAAIDELAEKRRKSLVSYNLDAEDPTDSITFIPKQFHLPGNEYKSELHAAVECYNNREEHYKRQTSALFHSFLLRVAHEHLMFAIAISGKKKKKSEVVAEQLIKYLNNNYSKRITSSEIAEIFEINYDYLNRVVSSVTGNSIFEYLNTVRINNAKQLIATTDLPFSEIAYLVGIDDRYYFSKLFRKHAGMSPSEYYKTSRQV